MHRVERAIRVFGAGFERPHFANWVRTRSAELHRAGVPHVVLVVWGPLEFTVSTLPRERPEFVVRLDDGTIERSPWAPAAAE